MKTLFFVCISLFLFCSCASSERMMRISGINPVYSIPKADRLKGMKDLPRLTQKISPARQIGGEINIWPFFFRHRDYWNALWPMIDFDAYGFAVRPFYVQEGREKSVLFPLTAWNDESGWVLNTYWRNGCFGIAPLFHYSKNFSFYGPLWNRGGSYGVFPLLKVAPDGGYCFPAYWRNKGGKLEKWGIFPIVDWGGDWKYIFPSLTYSSPSRWEFTYVFPCFLFSADTGNLLGPVWWYRNHSDKALVWGVAPLWYWRSSEKHFFLPFYYKGRNEFYSLFYSVKRSKDKQITSVLGPLYWKSSEPKREYTLAGGIFYKGEERNMKLYHILNRVNEKNFQEHKFLADLFCREYGLKTVKDYKGFAALKKELAGRISGMEYGVFPFFHKKSSQEEDEFDILKLIFRSGRVKKHLTTPPWGKGPLLERTYYSSPLLLSFYEKRFYDEEFISLPLLTVAHKKYMTHPADELRPLIYTGLRYKGKFAGNFFRLNCNDLLKRYGIEIPERIVDVEQLRFYLEYLKYSGTIPAELRSRGHGFLPLYLYERSNKGAAFYLNCLLSGWGEDSESKFA